MFKTKWLSLAFGLATLTALPASAAPLIYTLTADHCTGTCGTAPFGTVKLEQVLGDPFSVDVTVTLINASKIIHTGGPHQTFAFNISGGTATPPKVKISNLSAQFVVEESTFAAGQYTVDYTLAGTQDKEAGGFGYFAYLIDWTGGNGGGNGSPGPLSFRVTEVGHTLSPADFISGTNSQTCTGSGSSEICKPSGTASGYNFAADVLGNNGKTGEVGAPSIPIVDAPEPATLALFATGLAGLGAYRRRRKA